MNLKKQAAEHFDISLDEVTEKHQQFIKDQNRAKNYGGMGVPKRRYRVNDNGSIEFIDPIVDPVESDLLD